MMHVINQAVSAIQFIEYNSKISFDMSHIPLSTIWHGASQCPLHNPERVTTLFHEAPNPFLIVKEI